MLLKAKLVLPIRDATWVREMELPFPPFPGLGIRVDVYELLNVRGVVVGDPGHDVTGIVELEGDDLHDITDAKLESLGFEVGPIRDRKGTTAILVVMTHNLLPKVIWSSGLAR